MSRRKTKPTHTLLGISGAFAEASDALTKLVKECSFFAMKVSSPGVHFPAVLTLFRPE
jgi:hypothetical protein